MKAAFSAAAFAALSCSVSGAPTARRQASGVTDADILNYALTLEHLEDTFYRQGLANYTQQQFADAGFDETFYHNLMTVSKDESTHVSFLTTGLMAAGATPVKECTYAFPATDPKSFVMVASILEGVGVSAYLGAAADIMSKEYLTDAGSILTVESRHSAYLRSSLGESPFPQSFDVPLDFNEVYTLAAPFIASCPPDNPMLPVKAFPMLMAEGMGAVMTGAQVNVKTAMPVDTTGKNVQAAFITVTGPVFVPVMPCDDGMTYTVTIPEGVKGQSYVVINDGTAAVSDDSVIAGPAIVEIM